MAMQTLHDVREDHVERGDGAVVVGRRAERRDAVLELHAAHGDRHAAHAVQREAAVLHGGHVVVLEEHDAVRVLDHRATSA